MSTIVLLRRKRAATFYSTLASFLTSVPCSSRNSVGAIRTARGRFRCAFCLVLHLLKMCYRLRIRGARSEKEISYMLRAGSCMCVFRFGLSNATTRTLRRVRSGKCTAPCRASAHGIATVNIDFSSRAVAIRR